MLAQACFEGTTLMMKEARSIGSWCGLTAGATESQVPDRFEHFLREVLWRKVFGALSPLELWM